MRRAARCCPASTRATCISSPARPSWSNCISSASRGSRRRAPRSGGFAAERPDEPLLIGQSADYTILSEHASGDARTTSTASSRSGRSSCSRPITTPPGPTPRRSSSVACCRAAGSGRATRSSWAEDGLAAGELREMEAFQPVIERGASRRARAPRPLHRRRARSGAEPSRAGARPRHHPARARLLRQPRHHQPAEHGRQFLPARLDRRAGAGRRFPLPGAGTVPFQELHGPRRARQGRGDARALRLRAPPAPASSSCSSTACSTAGPP